MVVRDPAGHGYSPSSFKQSFLWFQYSFGLSILFSLVEVGVLLGVPLFGALLWVNTSGASGLAVLAVVIVSVTTAGGRTGLGDNSVHRASPWPSWKRVDRFAQNWVAIIRDDGVIRLLVYYWSIVILVSGVAGLLLAFETPAIVVALASGLTLVRVADLYTNSSLWNRDDVG